jgi:hypothetical protein
MACRLHNACGMELLRQRDRGIRHSRLLALLNARRTSLRSRYLNDVARELAIVTPSPLCVTEADLAALPPLVQRYLRRVCVLGRPRPTDVFVRAHGEMRNGIDARWLEIEFEQHNRLGSDPVRLFYLHGSMFGLPFDGYHRYVGPEATMEVRAASLVDMVNARGPEMNQSETVTLLNDMCVLAPASLIDAPIVWHSLDDSRVSATFSNAGQSISAELVFDQEGDLVNFHSDDRYMSSDGKTYLRYRWSTPLRDYRMFGDEPRARVASFGEAVWSLPSGDFTYGRFTIDDVRYNVANDMR